MLNDQRLIAESASSYPFLGLTELLVLIPDTLHLFGTKKVARKKRDFQMKSVRENEIMWQYVRWL